MSFYLKKKFEEFSSKINWIRFVLVCVFSLSSWICVTSIWTELAVIVYEVEEGWRLPSILVVVTQLGQIVPALIYPLIKYKRPNLLKNRNVIYVKLIGEMFLLIFLMFVWRKTVVVANETRTIGLYIINFFCSLFDGLSLVTYLPYIQEHLKNEYIISMYIGESFSQLAPSTITFIQGITHDKSSCHPSNATLSSHLVKFKPNVNFSVEIFFSIILLILFVSSLAFYLLNLNIKSACMTETIPSSSSEKPEEEAFVVVQNQQPENKTMKPTNKGCRLEKVILLSIEFSICFIMYGVLLGLQSYSTLSYGHTAFHMSINLGNLFLPVAVFVSIFSYQITTVQILAEFALGLLFSAYIIVVSTYSPCPPLYNHWLGSTLVVAAWILAECVFTRLRCVLASKVEKYKSERLLVVFGSVSLLGQMTGGVLIFLMVDVFRMFTHKPDCVFDFSYCDSN